MLIEGLESHPWETAVLTWGQSLSQGILSPQGTSGALSSIYLFPLIICALLYYATPNPYCLVTGTAGTLRSTAVKSTVSPLSKAST